jgi:hypothetical protein
MNWRGRRLKCCLFRDRIDSLRFSVDSLFLFSSVEAVLNAGSAYPQRIRRILTNAANFKIRLRIEIQSGHTQAGNTEEQEQQPALQSDPKGRIT